MLVKAGQRLRSVACATEVMVVRAPKDEVELTCGGAALVPLETPAADPTGVPEGSEGTALGKRYADDESGVELLCTKAGAGDLACNGIRLPIKGAKPLPSSD